MAAIFAARKRAACEYCRQGEGRRHLFRAIGGRRRYTHRRRLGLVVHHPQAARVGTAMRAQKRAVALTGRKREPRGRAGHARNMDYHGEREYAAHCR